MGVKPIRGENGITTDFVEGEHPCYGNGDDSVDILQKKLRMNF